jgi:hypothetical protein
MSGRTPRTAKVAARTTPAEVMTPPVAASPRTTPMVAPAADLLLGLLGAVRRRIVDGSLSATDATDAVMGLLRSGWFGTTRS